MKEETTYGLTPDRLARLLAIGAEGSDAQDNAPASATPAKVLEDMLARELPLDSAMPDSLPALLNRRWDEIRSAAGHTIGHLLLDSGSDLVVIKALKDYGKALVRRRGPEAKQAAATVIYYAAIASALVFHGHRITRYSYQKLHEAYTELKQKPWVSSELRDLFQKARAVCGQRNQKPE